MKICLSRDHTSCKTRLEYAHISRPVATVDTRDYYLPSYTIHTDSSPCAFPFDATPSCWVTSKETNAHARAQSMLNFGGGGGRRPITATNVNEWCHRHPTPQRIGLCKSLELHVMPILRRNLCISVRLRVCASSSLFRRLLYRYFFPNPPPKKINSLLVSKSSLDSAQVIESCF